MKKRDELSSPNSCLNKAKDGEWLFVLLGRDEAFSAAVEAWIAKRIELGMNVEGDDKIRGARLACVQATDARSRDYALGRNATSILVVRGWIAYVEKGHLPGPFIELRVSEAKAWIAEVEQELRDAEAKRAVTDIIPAG